MFFSRKRKKPELADYQKEWNAMLGSGNTNAGAFLGIFIAMVLFACLMSLPWTMDYLQNQGTIKPRIYFNEELELNSHLKGRTERDDSAKPSANTQAAQPTADSTYSNSEFGKPLQ